MNLARFGLFALFSAGPAWMLLRRGTAPTAGRLWAAALLVVVIADLFVAHGRFNPAADVALSPLNPDAQPPVVRFLNEREARTDGEIVPWRFTTFNAPGEKTFNANAACIRLARRPRRSIIPANTPLMGRIARRITIQTIAPPTRSKRYVHAADNSLLTCSTSAASHRHAINRAGRRSTNKAGVYENRRDAACLSPRRAPSGG